MQNQTNSQTKRSTSRRKNKEFVHKVCCRSGLICRAGPGEVCSGHFTWYCWMDLHCWDPLSLSVLINSQGLFPPSGAHRQLPLTQPHHPTESQSRTAEAEIFQRRNPSISNTNQAEEKENNNNFKKIPKYFF